MKIGDLVKVKEEHWSDRNRFGIIVGKVFANAFRSGDTAFRVMFSNGKIRAKLSRTLEVYNENR